MSFKHIRMRRIQIKRKNSCIYNSTADVTKNETLENNLMNSICLKIDLFYLNYVTFRQSFNLRILYQHQTC